ncbi:MAG: phage tail assembly chaperone [Rhodobacteraceae bacterium]|nr:phage tail assembly chaperone [Paracoccaceae bacterium]
MADFIIYDHTTGGPDEYPIRGWGHCPDGLEAQQVSEAGETSVVSPVPVADLYDYLGYVYDPAEDTITNVIAPSIGVSEVDVRREIAQRLRDSDWTQLADSPLTPAAQPVWDAYRAALRAIPQQAQFPDNVTWPDVPADVEF